MNALTLTEDFQISAGERNAYKVALARAEGDLLIIAAHRRLGLNTSTDEDGFPYYVWEMAHVARDLAELSVRKRTFFFGSAVKDEQGLIYDEHEHERYGA